MVKSKGFQVEQQVILGENFKSEMGKSKGFQKHLFSANECFKKNCEKQTPMFYNPRKLTRKQLVTELEKRDLNTKGKHGLLAARLQEELIKENQNIDFFNLDDDCVEKWIAVGHNAHVNVHKINSDINKIVKIQNELNEALKGITYDELVSLGNRKFKEVPRLVKYTKSEFYREITVSTVALMLSVHFQMLNPNLYDSIVQASMICGETGLPKHWSVEKN